ncbi:hypothetical protein IP84_06290 [beta proteobacterium AAP99]|nr:hypothetical protein IP84_06290 [beta proteobacterium AAP99]
MRRYNRFIDDLQLEFGVCFSLADFETNHSLESIVHRIAYLVANPRGSRRSLANQRRVGFGFGPLIVLLLLGSAAMYFGPRAPAVALGIVGACGLIAIPYAIAFFRWRRYVSALTTKICSNDPQI